MCTKLNDRRIPSAYVLITDMFKYSGFDGEWVTPTCIKMLKKLFNKESEKVCHFVNDIVHNYAACGCL